jgi:hypothetical protein
VPCRSGSGLRCAPALRWSGLLVAFCVLGVNRVESVLSEVSLVIWLRVKGAMVLWVLDLVKPLLLSSCSFRPKSATLASFCWSPGQLVLVCFSAFLCFAALPVCCCWSGTVLCKSAAIVGALAV